MILNKKYNILITGAKGQLGSFLLKNLTNDSMYEKSKIGKVIGIDIDDLDLSDADEVSYFFNRSDIDLYAKHIKYDYVIHCAAATNTAAIEDDPIKYYPANVLATKNIARACAQNNTKLIFISTDYVFSEYSRCVYSRDTIERYPVNQYGLQKMLAEDAVELEFKNKPRNSYYILRSSWMFGNSNKSFVEKLIYSIFKGLGAYACNNDAKSHAYEHFVVDDAYGRPTPVSLIYQVISKIISYDGNILKAQKYTCIPVHVDHNSPNVIDCQYDIKQISRYDWANMIFDSFKTIANDSISNEKHDPPLALQTYNSIGVKISPTSSNSINSKMRHPGEVVMLHMQSERTFIYETVTNMYIKEHINDLIDVATKGFEDCI